MDFRVLETIGPDSREMRAYFSEKMNELAERDERIVYLCADLVGTLSMGSFLKKFPERGYNVGIAEANMIGVAAGLAATGKIPFCNSFGPFATRRCFDQVFLSCAYARLNVKIIGSDPGVTAAFNGGTHMPFEDVGIMRCVPGITIIDPCDAAQTVWALEEAAKNDGVYYIRTVRKGSTKVYADGSAFEIGKAAKLREGKDVSILACGILVSEALRAADALEKEGISARVLDMYSIKPIDREAVAAAARETGCIVTAENHNVIGGLASAVSEALGETFPAPVEKVGVMDEFGEVGPEKYLRERFHLTPEAIASAARRAVARKAK